MFKKNFISVILAAGGAGSRIGSPIPKQFLPLNGRPIALHSFNLFSQMEEIDEIIVVCEPEYRHLFPNAKFALPGPRRQDSIYNGFKIASGDIICTHDAARPFIEKDAVRALLEKAIEMGAATLAAPVTSTIKIATAFLVDQTLDRSTLWEIQTPQAMIRSYFENAQNIEVTDDVSIAEILQKPVAIIPSTSRNFKITTPEDLKLASLCATN